jgi:hypothetical protein
VHSHSYARFTHFFSAVAKKLTLPNQISESIMHLHFKFSRVVFAALLLSALGACGGGGNNGTSPSPPDTSAPTITASATVGTEAVVLSAVVSDNVAVTQVEFIVDGGVTTATVTDLQGRTLFSTSIPATTLGPGSHNLVARAHDAAGNVTDTAAVGFSVSQGAAPPSPIKLTTSGTNEGGNVTFTVDIQSDKQIKLVNFFIDGEFVGGRADDQRHYSFSRMLPSGTHHLIVDVTDVNGNNSQAEVTVQV